MTTRRAADVRKSQLDRQATKAALLGELDAYLEAVRKSDKVQNLQDKE